MKKSTKKPTAPRKKKPAVKLPVTKGSDNVYRDLGLPDADVLQAKSDAAPKKKSEGDEPKLPGAALLAAAAPKPSENTERECDDPRCPICAPARKRAAAYSPGIDPDLDAAYGIQSTTPAPIADTALRITRVASTALAVLCVLALLAVGVHAVRQITPTPPRVIPASAPSAAPSAALIVAAPIYFPPPVVQPVPVVNPPPPPRRHHRALDHLVCLHGYPVGRDACTQ